MRTIVVLIYLLCALGIFMPILMSELLIVETQEVKHHRVTGECYE